MLHIVTDFDGTLMHQDVGDEIMHTLGVVERPETREVSRLFMEKKIGTAKWIQTAFAFLENRQQEVDAVLERMRPRDGAERFLHYCREREYPVTVLSDGMRYYIDRLLERHQLEVDEIVANPIGYSASGQFLLGVQNDNPACDWCGCCKAGKVRSIKQAGEKVIYLGDGVSDFYGSRFADWIFARGSLARYLDKLGETYFPFETFHDVIAVMKEQRLESLASGPIISSREEERIGQVDICKFA